MISRLAKFGFASVIVSAAVSHVAFANVVTLDFSGPQQGFAGVITGRGTAKIQGSNQVLNPDTKALEQFISLPPNDHPLVVLEPFGFINSHPISIGLPNPPVTTTVDMILGKLPAKLTNLDLEFLNGVTAPFEFETIDIPSNSSLPQLATLALDIGGEFTSITFQQTGFASFVPNGPATGTFNVPGTFGGRLDNLSVRIGEFINAGPFFIDFAGTGSLSGNFEVSGPPEARKLALDGTLLPTLHAHIGGVLVASASEILQVTFTATNELLIDVTIAGGFHLEQTLVVPEPASLVLLVVGLTALVSCRRSSRRVS
jgi:hypothetical protein